MEKDQVFNKYSKYYNLLYSDKNYSAESDYIDKILASHGQNYGKVLELGCGTGGHARFLAQKGYIVHGIEQSSAMVKQATPCQNFSCEQGDICSFRIEEKFNAVIALFHVISYQTTNRKLDAVFDNASKHLVDSGIFVFDFWFTPAVCSKGPEVRVKRMHGDGVEIIRIAEPEIHSAINQVDVKYSIFVRDTNLKTVEIISETHKMRHFSLMEIDLLCEKHGFHRVYAKEMMTSQLPSNNTWGICVVLKKN
jgi:SAM-dependent methyltransferase